MKQEFRRLGVTHIKIKVPGKDIPGDDIFAQLVKCSLFHEVGLTSATYFIRFSAALGKFLNDRTKEGRKFFMNMYMYAECF